MTRSAPAALVLLLGAWGCRPFPTEASGEDAAVTDAGLAGFDVNVESSVGQGYLAVQARACGQCHQSPDPDDGVLSGQTTAVPGTQAYGSNLTPDPETGMDSWEAGTIAQSVLRAVDPQGNPLCPAMPAYVDAGMSPSEALAIAAYLQSLTPVWHPVPPSSCPDD
jgi:mono/diheme cytochrome c family protein